MGALAVLFIIFAVAGVIFTLSFLVAACVNNGYNGKKREDFGVAAVLGILTFMLIIGAYLFGSTHYSNHFYKLYEEYNTSRANVGIMEAKADALEDDLTTLLNIYIEHEGSLVDVVGGRNLEELRLLFERYPQLQASSNVQQVTSEFITLVEDIVNARLVVNAVARAYNTSQNIVPTSWFAPKDLPASLTLISLEVIK